MAYKIQKCLNVSKILITLAAFLILTACSTTETVVERDSQAGLSRTFNAPQPALVSITKSVLEEQGLNITSTAVDGGSSTITFSKPVSAFSWGEVGRLIFTSVSAESTQVFVTTERRGALNITAKSQASFASEIFAGIEEALANS